MSKWIHIYLITILSLERINGYCYTAWGAPGRCVNIKQCDPLMRILRPRPIRPTVLRILQKAQCGFDGLDPKVCCKVVVNDDEHSSSDDSTSTKSLLNMDFVETTTTMKTTTTTRTTTEPTPLVPVHEHPNRRLLDEKICGPIPEGRIFGGNVTSIYEFPWMALLGYDIGNDKTEFRCGASLISKRYVLTAAHCTSELPNDFKLTSVRIGDHDLGSEVDCDSWENNVGYNCAVKYQEFGIERIHVHPDFTRRKLLNDISLVRIDREADLVPPSVRPICLPIGQASSIRTKKLVATGWGSTEFGVKSRRLLKVTLPIVELKKCDSAYRYQMVKIWHKQICAGGANMMDSCSGDSGGPLQAVGIYDGQPRNVLYGIVSFGPHSCGIEGYPGVYTRVDYYVNWILDTITD